MKLRKNIKDLNQKCSVTSTSGLYKGCLMLQMEFNNPSIHQAEKNILRTRHRYYEHREGAERLLAQQLKQEHNNSKFTEFNIKPNTTTCNAQLINGQFK